jgi:hypothetical protein
VVDPWTTNADNLSGFFGVPRGIADGVGGYDGAGGFTYIWTATEVSGGVAWSVGFPPGTDIASLGSNNDKTFGVRYIHLFLDLDGDVYFSSQTFFNYVEQCFKRHITPVIFNSRYISSFLIH